ncbi:hypothetical protein Taro_037863, partial [Colocasia esculenta]|nr:hypothetical protein [Colocasia esculenta]
MVVVCNGRKLLILNLLCISVCLVRNSNFNMFCCSWRIEYCLLFEAKWNWTFSSAKYGCFTAE